MLPRGPTLLALAALLLAGCTAAPPPPAHGPEPDVAASPYVAQQHTAVRGLSAQEIADLEAGNGMGYARPAELNGYPGPRHVLDLAAELDLTEEQRAGVQRVFEGMQAEARAQGREVLAAHAALEAAFREHRADDAAMETLVVGLEGAEAALRLVHLRAHLATKALLTEEQVAAYHALRGYDAPSQGGSGAHGGHGGHGA